jgi:hypothetical protein
MFKMFAMIQEANFLLTKKLASFHNKLMMVHILYFSSSRCKHNPSPLLHKKNLVRFCRRFLRSITLQDGKNV